MPRSPRAVTVALALACGATVAAPLWVGRFLPLLDLPQHLALATVLMQDPADASPLLQWYEPQPFELTPYWLHYVLLAGIGELASVETAARIVLSAYAVALPWAAMELAGAVGAPRRAGLMAAPLALGTNFYHGFLAYCLAVVLSLVVLALVVRQARGPRRSRAVLLAALAMVLFFAHVQALAFVGLATLAIARRARGTGARAAALLPLVPAGLLLALWVYQATTPRPGRERYFASLDDPRPRFEPFPHRVRGIPGAIAGAYRDRSDRVLLGAWAVSMGALAWTGRRARPRAAGTAALPVVALACTLLLPFSVQGQWNIAPRFAWVAALLLVPFASAPGAGWLAVVLSLATGLNAARLHRAFDAEVDGFDRVLEEVPRGSRVLPLVYDTRGRLFETWPYLHFGQYAAVRRESYVAHSFAANAPLPVRIRPAGRVPVQGVWRADQFVFEEHAAPFDAFLVRDLGGRDPLRDRPGLRRAASAGPWTAYLRTR